MEDRLNFQTAYKLNEMLKKKQIAFSDISGSILSAIDALGKKINAYIRVEKESTLMQAKELDKNINRSTSINDFTGIPIAIVPAMHATMYDNPMVIDNIKKLKKAGINIQ